MRRNRTFIVLLVIVTTMALATTALAGKHDKPDKPSAAYFDVTIGLISSEPGLDSSECHEPDTALTASESGGHAGSVLQVDGESGTSLADLYYQGDGLEDGCYTGIAEDSPRSGAQFFRVYRTKAGELDHIDWFFDVAVTLHSNKNGKPTGGYQVTHKYWLKSLDFDLEWTGGIVTGTFELWEYALDDDPRWTPLATPTLTFTLDIAPVS